MYGDFECVEWLSATKVKVKSGQFARMLNIPSDKFRDHLVWLNDEGFIKNLDKDYGVAFFNVVYPPKRTGDF